MRGEHVVHDGADVRPENGAYSIARLDAGADAFKIRWMDDKVDDIEELRVKDGSDSVEVILDAATCRAGGRGEKRAGNMLK